MKVNQPSLPVACDESYPSLINDESEVEDSCLCFPLFKKIRGTFKKSTGVISSGNSSSVISTCKRLHTLDYSTQKLDTFSSFLHLRSSCNSFYSTMSSESYSNFMESPEHRCVYGSFVIDSEPPCKTPMVTCRTSEKTFISSTEILRTDDILVEEKSDTNGPAVSESRAVQAAAQPLSLEENRGTNNKSDVLEEETVSGAESQLYSTISAVKSCVKPLPLSNKAIGFIPEIFNQASFCNSKSPCNCGHAAHYQLFDPIIPIMKLPSFADAYQEALIVSGSLVGEWVTILERSESLDNHYRLLGLGMVKRAIMNRLAVPLTMFLEDEDSVLHCWIHTPLGIRHMRSNLYGLPSSDDDPDAGLWTGTTTVIDYSIPWFCNGRPVRALQQVRHNANIGTCIETRCILPDEMEKIIMLFNFVMIPNGKDDTHKISADRILKKINDNVSQ